MSAAPRPGCRHTWQPRTSGAAQLSALRPGRSLIFLDFLVVAPESVDASSKDREDGEKVSREFLFGAEVSLIENHELSAVAFEQASR